MRLFVHKTGVMHNIIQTIARGYHWYVTGSVDVKRFDPMLAKFTERYLIDATHKQRATRRAKGLGNSFFFAYPAYETASFDWFLLLTDGDHPMRSTEAGLRDTRDRRNRLSFQGSFEPLLLPAAGDVPRWTWRLTASFEEQLMVRITEAVRRRRDDKAIIDVMNTCHSLPGFRGVRQQVMRLRSHTQAEWSRAKQDGPCPYIPARIPPYVRFKQFNAVPHEIVRDRMLRGEAPFSDLMRYGSAREGLEAAEMAPLANAGAD